MKIFRAFVIAGLLLVLGAHGPVFAKSGQNETKPVLQGPSSESSSRTTALLAEEVRHQLVMLPYYGVFDWLEGEVRPDDTVVLRGQVTRPTTKSEAEARIRKLESVANVVNNIQVLPLSSYDDNLRLRLYRAIFNYNSPLFRYATQVTPSIHIIVQNGRATLKGVVATKMDRQLAYTAARGVPDLFDVEDELMVERPE